MRIIDKNNNVWKPYNNSDEYFYCPSLDKIEWIKHINIKKMIKLD